VKQLVRQRIPLRKGNYEQDDSRLMMMNNTFLIYQQDNDAKSYIEESNVTKFLNKNLIYNGYVKMKKKDVLVLLEASSITHFDDRPGREEELV
jgi:hypothetical protein